MTGSTTVSPTSKSPPFSVDESAGQTADATDLNPAAGRGRLTGMVRSVDELTPDERERMYTLLARYFANVTRAGFEHDLAEKEWSLLLADASTGQLQGFSTLMRLRAVVDERPVVAFFSGDTIVAREYWGETALSRLWARHVFGRAGQIRRQDPETQVYWFLISSGYKTYRFLPTFFRDFYPAYDRPTPSAIRRTLDALALPKFGAAYDREHGVVRLPGAAPLRPGVAEASARHLSDPHVAFFFAANPGHVRGDELACLTEITPANLTPAGRRMLGPSPDAS